MNLDAPSVQPAVIVEKMIDAAEPCCFDIEFSGKKFFQPVTARVRLDVHELEHTHMFVWSWDFEIITAKWNMTLSCGPESVVRNPPNFDTAIVPFGQIWRQVTHKAWRISVSDEFRRLKSIIDAYDENWWVSVRERADPNNFGEFRHDGSWSERDMARAIKFARQAWLETPEGFFESQAAKKAAKKAKNASR